MTPLLLLVCFDVTFLPSPQPEANDSKLSTALAFVALATLLFFFRKKRFESAATRKVRRLLFLGADLTRAVCELRQL